MKAGSGVGVVAAGVGVGAACVAAGGAEATWSVSSASWMMATATAIAASATITPARTSGARQPGAATTRVPTAAPQFRHHSCSSVIAAPQRGQRRSVGGGVSTAVTCRSSA